MFSKYCSCLFPYFNTRKFPRNRTEECVSKHEEYTPPSNTTTCSNMRKRRHLSDLELQADYLKLYNDLCIDIESEGTEGTDGTDGSTSPFIIINKD